MFFFFDFLHTVGTSTNVFNIRTFFTQTYFENNFGKKKTHDFFSSIFWCLYKRDEKIHSHMFNLFIWFMCLSWKTAKTIICFLFYLWIKQRWSTFTHLHKNMRKKKNTHRLTFFFFYVCALSLSILHSFIYHILCMHYAHKIHKIKVSIFFFRFAFRIYFRWFEYRNYLCCLNVFIMSLHCSRL